MWRSWANGCGGLLLRGVVFGNPSLLANTERMIIVGTILDLIPLLTPCCGIISFK